MSLLRIHCRLLNESLKCEWVLIGHDRESVSGEGQLTEMPKRARRVQLVIPGEQVLLTHTRLPNSARRRTGPVLAFAVEEETISEPDANQVSWVGSAGGGDVLAVVDKKGLSQCLNALEAAAIRVDEIYCETLLLPWTDGEWSLAWNGLEGFVRTGEFEGVATDCGDRTAPPLSLQLMLEDAETREARPTSIALYTTAQTRGLVGETAVAPDIEAWQRQLGVAIRIAGAWDWRIAPAHSNVRLSQERKRWPLFSGILPRLRPAAWIVAATLAVHSMALVVDWILLAGEENALRQQMEARFRTLFPATIAVVDPALQMRHKLVDARHAAGIADSSDFLPMLQTVAPALEELAQGSLRAIAYESGTMTLELAIDEAARGRLVSHLLETGLSVDGSLTAPEAGSGMVVINLRVS